MAWTNDLRALREHDLNQLVPLVALLRAQGVSPAARQLEISQPAMSKLLERLRADIGDALLVREANRMRLTPVAQALLPLAEEALAAAAKVYLPREFAPALATGRFRVGANDYVQHVVGGRLINALAREAPRLGVEFRPVGMLQPEHLLGDRLVDLIIGATVAHLNLRSRLLYRDPMVCVAAPGPAIEGPLEPEAFCARPHLDVSPSGLGLLRGLIDRALAGRSSQPRQVVASVSSFMGVPGILRDTALLAVVPLRAAQAFGDAVQRVPLAFEMPAYEVSMWWHNATHGDPLAQWMRARIEALMQAPP